MRGNLLQKLRGRALSMHARLRLLPHNMQRVLKIVLKEEYRACKRMLGARAHGSEYAARECIQGSRYPTLEQYKHAVEKTVKPRAQASHDYMTRCHLIALNHEEEHEAHYGDCKGYAKERGHNRVL